MIQKLGRSFGIVLVFCLVSRGHGQTTGLSIDREHLSSIAEAHFASLEGWRTGDLLIRYSTTGDGRYVTDREVDGPDAMSILVREDYVSRVLFDFDLDRALVINRCEREVQLFNALDQEVQRPAIFVDHRVLLYDKAAELQLEKTETGIFQRASKLSPLRSAMGAMGIPSLQSWGSTEFVGWNLELLRTGIQFNNDVHNIERLENVGKNTYRVIAKDREGTLGKFSGQFETDWDVQRNVPVRFVAYHADPNEYEPAATTSVKWKAIDSAFVPESARLSKRSIEVFAGLRFHLKEETNADVHWFSFNSELSKELFSEELLHDRAKLDELLSTDVFDDKPKDNQTPKSN